MHVSDNSDTSCSPPPELNIDSNKQGVRISIGTCVNREKDILVRVDILPRRSTLPADNVTVQSAPADVSQTNTQDDQV